MTGEVTLRGRVLPVGGVREKALAALRAGITRVILPQANRHELRQIPSELKRRITFIPVTHMDEVLEAALEGGGRDRTRKRTARTRLPQPAASPSMASKK